MSMVAKDEVKMGQYGVVAISQWTKVNAENLTVLTSLIESKKVKPQVDKIYTLDRIKEAFEAKEKGEVLGKIVIQIAN